MFSKLLNFLFPKMETEKVTDRPINKDHNYIKELKQRYKKYNYQNIPYIESQESAKWILENYEHSSFGAVLVPKEYMDFISFDNKNYLFGEIVFLWWITSRKNISNIPHYFARTYGIDATQAKNKLIQNKLLTKEFKTTDSGQKLLDTHKDVIKKHRADKSWSGTGKVRYNYTRILTGKAKEQESLKQILLSFDEEIKFYKENDIKYFEWLPAKDPCPTCKKLYEQDLGYGQGIYPLNAASEVRKKIHPFCRCTITPSLKDI